MFQVLQNVKNGDLTLTEVPIPTLQPGMVLVRTAASLISAGTEKMLMELAQKSMIGKAQARPDLVKQVLAKAKKEGYMNTLQNVLSKLEKPMPLGYSASGVVEASSSQNFVAGDRVAIAGAGYANHADMNSVPSNLVVKIPDNVSFEEAAYGTVGSIALQGVRIANPQIGDYVVVSGLGLIGLITVQILLANGCRVIGLDYDAKKIALAIQLGMHASINLATEDPVKKVEVFTKGRLADCTIITAATKSNQPIELAGEITRRKGSVVAVGAVGMSIPRDSYYKKELDIKLSMSYGPGRYDITYEEGGIDYPYDYVRWTEQRNLEALLDLISAGKLDVKSLTSHFFPFSEALKAYDMISNNSEYYVGIILQYDMQTVHTARVRLGKESQVTNKDMSNSKVTVGFAGAGNYASVHLLPHLSGNKSVSLIELVTATGLSAKQKGEKFGFASCSTDYESILKNPDINTVFIATRHSTHSKYVVDAIKSGKNVFVEKPFVTNEEELQLVIDAYQEAQVANPVGLMAGLNRRFSPLMVEIKSFVPQQSQKHMIYRVNSGYIPLNTWLHLPEEGGGMLVGEMCHFIDVMHFLTDEQPVSVFAQSLSLGSNTYKDSDNVSITVSFSKGSVGTLCYNTIGDKSLSKERLEVYANGYVAVLDDFRSLTLTSNGKSKTQKSPNQDKGQKNQIEKTIEAFLKNSSAIRFEELVSGMQVIFAAQRSLLSGQKEHIS